MDKDIQEMFRQKNREILIHNLQLDIDRNMDVLTDTLTNIFDLQFDTAIKNIVVMYNDHATERDISKILVPLKTKSFMLLSSFIGQKKDLLLKKLDTLEFIEEQMQEYYDLVFSTTQDVLVLFDEEKLQTFQKEAIDSLQDLVSSLLEESAQSIVQYRIRDYVIERLFGKLKDKVRDEFLIRDNNLSNKGRESYDKFQDLEKKTTNI